MYLGGKKGRAALLMMVLTFGLELELVSGESKCNSDEVWAVLSYSLAAA